MKRTVLVVDDEQNMQTVMRMILEDAGHVVITASSGEEAWSQCSGAQPMCGSFRLGARSGSTTPGSKPRPRAPPSPG